MTTGEAAGAPQPARALRVLRADADQLSDEINDLIETWDAVDEVDTGLGTDIEEAGRSLGALAAELAGAVSQADPRLAQELAEFAGDIGEPVSYYADLEEHDTNASIDIVDLLGPGISLAGRAVRVLEDWCPPPVLTAIADLRGSMADGYGEDEVNSALGRIGEAAGLKLACVWGFRDFFGAGGDSQFYVEQPGGQFRETAGSLWRWLNEDRGSPDTSESPGSPGTWTGNPAGFTAADLGYHDGACNYAWQDRASAREDDEDPGPHLAVTPARADSPAPGTGQPGQETGNAPGGLTREPLPVISRPRRAPRQGPDAGGQSRAPRP